MSDIDDILDKESCDATYCGRPVHEPAKYDAARLELAQLRRAVEALRKAVYYLDRLDDENIDLKHHGDTARALTSARAILAEIDGKEPTDGK